MSASTAVQFLRNACSRAQITTQLYADGASRCVAINVGVNGLILISGAAGGARENEIDYHPREHQGWGAVYYSDCVHGDDVRDFYQSTDPDLVQDTSRLLAAVQNIIAGH
ncbi:hypothetical protein ABT160_38185 [Streptomyces sp. NPDC001941]|uniref:hypothetical protein n=1 Tax=Streptomyces sp. NPDC001941 TaxID=3154659 RepID=UPI0033318B09